MADPVPLIQVEKPALGRASDSRVTQEYIDARPELAGVPPFVPGVDIDLVDEFNQKLAAVHALVKYASPELAASLIDVLTGLLEVVPEAEQTITNLNGLRAVVITPDTVTLTDSVPANITEGTHTTLSGIEIPIATIDVSGLGQIKVLRADGVDGLIEVNTAGVDAAQATADAAQAQATALSDNLTLRGAGADATGAADVTTLLTARLTAGAGKLGRGSFKIATGISVPLGVTLRGESTPGTVLRPFLAPGGYAVQVAAAPVANDWPAWGVAAENLTIDGTGAPNAGTTSGLRMGGAYRTVRGVRVKEVVNGVVYNQSHTYLSRLENFSVYSCAYGVVFETGVIDSGENIVLDGGAIFNNVHNLYIKEQAWDITLRDVSLDYPTTTQILVTGLAQFTMQDGHVENGAGVALLGAVNPNTDAGVLRFNSVSFAGSATATSTANDLIGPNIRSATLVFRDCADVATHQRFNRVVWRQPDLPTSPPTVAAPWQNTTGVTARVTLTYSLPAAPGALGKVEAFSAASSAGMPLVGTLYAPAGAEAQSQVLVVDVPHRHYLGVGMANATFTSMRIEGLA